jgi:hypothetical protein
MIPVHKLAYALQKEKAPEPDYLAVLQKVRPEIKTFEDLAEDEI